jgi:CelD/BcsL family acetyltransferase involved in cellulose biosynthesis
MFVRRLESWDAAEAIRDDWNRLADGIPFRTWQWLGTWWQHYGAGRNWFVLAVCDTDGKLKGIAPWCIEHVPAFGRVLQWLGTGEVCSDHLSILCHAEDRTAVAAAIAQWLMDDSRPGDSSSEWDMISFDCLSTADPCLHTLLAELENRGCSIHRQPDLNTWYLPLPATWDEYRSSLSKSNRRHVRQVQERLIDSGRVSIHVAQSAEEFARAWPIFVDLHQRRQQSLGHAGCFARAPFANFLRQAAEHFFQLGNLELMWIEDGHEPMAAQLGLIGNKVKFAYQAGINPEMLADSPGWLIHTQSIKRGIENGNRGFDFLRGDESHKHRMGGQPQPTISVRVVPPRIGPIMLHKVWVTGNRVKNWIKAGLEKTGIR